MKSKNETLEDIWKIINSTEMLAKIFERMAETRILINENKKDTELRNELFTNYLTLKIN